MFHMLVYATVSKYSTQLSILQILLRPTRPSPFINHIRARQQRLKRDDHEQENTHARRLRVYDCRKH